MSQAVEYVINRTSGSVALDVFSDAEAARVRAYHMALPGYAPTPLAALDDLAGRLGLAAVHVKDESFRFGLNAFKVLGASYAVGRIVAERLGLGQDALSLSAMTAPANREKLAGLVLATATDGNHGRAVAWAARQLGLGCVVHMPKGSAPARLEAIRALGAKADILEMNYDEAVRLTAAEAAKEGWIVVQDTAWDGYETIPGWIMQGYATMAEEACLQLEAAGRAAPTHVFVQAGVGSLAAGVVGRMSVRLKDRRPRFLVAEAGAADCLYRSALAGRPVTVEGDLTTIMAGLACGEPSKLAWPILKDRADVFVSCPDWVAARGMRILGNPRGGDPRVVSGESGAITLGLLTLIMETPSLAALRDSLDLGPQSRVLLFSTEGDTDPKRYRDIVWDGDYASAAQ